MSDDTKIPLFEHHWTENGSTGEQRLWTRFALEHKQYVNPRYLSHGVTLEEFKRRAEYDSATRLLSRLRNSQEIAAEIGQIKSTVMTAVIGTYDHTVVDRVRRALDRIQELSNHTDREIDR